MKKRDSRLRIRIFYGILIIPTILWLLLSLIGVAKILDYDSGEKRNKHEIAEDANLSNITSELESCYNDRVPFRSILLSINSTINWITELPYNKVIEPVLLHMANASMDKSTTETATASSSSPNADDAAKGEHVVGDETTGSANAADSSASSSGSTAGSQTSDTETATADSTVLPVYPATYETPTESGYYPYKEIVPEVIQGRDGWLFTTESYMDFAGGTLPSQETLVSKLSAITQLNDLCKSKGIELQVFAMPNKNVVYPEYMPTLDQVETCALNVLEYYITENSDVSFNYLDKEMLGAKQFGRLYYKTDTHWNNLGGFAAYAYMRNSLGLSPLDIGSYAVTQGEEYTGDLAQYTGLPAASFETEYSVDVNYKTDTTQTVVRGGDDYIDELTAQNTESDKTVVLVGDSYRHSLLPYLSRDYAHVYSLNGKQLSDEMKEIVNNADIIILESVERNVFFEVHYDNAVAGLTQLLQ